MKKYVVIGAAMLLGVAGTVVASNTNRRIPEAFPQSEWFCSNFENEMRIGIGSHPDIIMSVDIPANEVHDREICILVDKRQVTAVMQVQPR